MDSKRKKNSLRSIVNIGFPFFGGWTWVYRFGFNGKEKDNETYGEGNAYDFGARIYDARLGRWLSLDPREKEIPSEAPYVGIGNKPIMFYDPDGEKIVCEDRNTQREVLKAINSQALGRFDFNSKGELFLVTKAGDKTKYSEYFQTQLIAAINEKDKTIIIRKQDKAYNVEKEIYENVDDYGGGVTFTVKGEDGIVQGASVFYSGKETIVKDKYQKDMIETVNDIIMHELVGHAIPNITKPSSGDAVINENIVRKQTGKIERFVDGEDPE